MRKFSRAATERSKCEFRGIHWGAATLDYVLTLAVILPAVVFIFWAVPRILQLTYDMVCSLIAWPFL